MFFWDGQEAFQLFLPNPAHPACAQTLFCGGEDKMLARDAGINKLIRDAGKKRSQAMCYCFDGYIQDNYTGGGMQPVVLYPRQKSFIYYLLPHVTVLN